MKRCKLCILEIEEDRTMCYLIPESGRTSRRVVWVPNHRFPKTYQPEKGRVLNVDYTERAMAVIDIEPDMKVFPVQKEAVQTVVYRDYEVSTDEETAQEKYAKSLLNKKTRDETLSRSSLDIIEINF